MSRTQKKLILASLVVLLLDCASTKFREDYQIVMTSVGDAGLETVVIR